MKSFNKLRNYVSTAQCFSTSAIANLVLLAFVALLPMSLLAQGAHSKPEHIEWTWEVRPLHPDLALPNVLLIGDSITKNYFPQVANDLKGIANVYLMASSISVGDPRLTREIAQFSTMEGVEFRAVHFNNGMHGWGYSEAQFKASFPSYLRAVQHLVRTNRDLIWATITPVNPAAPNGATNARVDARNAIANHFVRAAGISIDDQHALMVKHQDLHLDSVHFNSQGQALQGEQAAESIRNVLKSSSR